MYTRSLARAQARLGRAVHVVGPQFAGASPWLDEGVAVHSGFRFGAATATLGLERAVRAVGQRTVHLQHEAFAFGGAVTALALPLSMVRLRARGHRFITTVHGVIPLAAITPEFVRQNAMRGPASAVRAVWQELIRSVCRASDVVHVHEAVHAEALRSEYGVRRPIEVVPMGVGLPAASTDRVAARRRLGLGPEARVLLFFGYLLERKGIGEFLDAVPALLARDPKLTILLGGVAPERMAGGAEVTARIAELARYERFRALGFVPDEDVGAVFDASDALILPYTFSMSASFPMSIAVGRGVPVLLSNRFAASYPDAPGLFDPTPDGIASVVGRFFTDAAFRAGAVRYARVAAEPRSWSAMAARLLAIGADLR